MFYRTRPHTEDGNIDEQRLRQAVTLRPARLIISLYAARREWILCRVLSP